MRGDEERGPLLLINELPSAAPIRVMHVKSLNKHQEKGSTWRMLRRFYGQFTFNMSNSVDMTGFCEQ